MLACLLMSAVELVFFFETMLVVELVTSLCYPSIMVIMLCCFASDNCDWMCKNLADTWKPFFSSAASLNPKTPLVHSTSSPYPFTLCPQYFRDLSFMSLFSVHHTLKSFQTLHHTHLHYYTHYIFKICQCLCSPYPFVSHLVMVSKRIMHFCTHLVAHVVPHSFFSDCPFWHSHTTN